MSFPTTREILDSFTADNEVGEALELWADGQLLDGPGLTKTGDQALIDRLGYILRRIATTPIVTDDAFEDDRRDLV